MQTTKLKFLRLLTSVVTLAYLLVLPQVVTAKTISDDVEDAVDAIQDLQDEMNDLEEEIDGTYGTTVATGDEDLTDSVSSTSLYLISGADTTWSSGEYIYKNGSGTATSVDVGDTRVLPYSSTYLGDTTVTTGDSDITGVAALTTATNLKITAGGELYIAAGATVAVNDTRVTNAKIVTLAKMTTHFTAVTNAIEDAQDELDDLKGETIPTGDLGDLEDAVDDLISDAESVIDMIEEKIHSNLNDQFDDKKEDFDGDVEDLEGDLSDVKAGLDTDNKDVDDFVDNLSDIESNVNDVEDSVSTNLNSSTMQGLISDLTDEYDDAEDEIDDLDGEEFTDTEKTKILNAWDDLETAFTDALDEIEDNVSGTVEDDFNDERDDFEDDLTTLEDSLNSILDGEGSTGISNRIQNSLDDLDEYKDDLKELNRVMLGTYGSTVQADDEDDGNPVTGVNLYKSGNYLYYKPTGNTASTPQVNDIRVLPYSATYRAGSLVKASDPDTATALTATSYYIDGSDTTYEAGDPVYTDTSISASDTISGGETRVNRAEIMYLPELQDIFSDIEDVTDDYDDTLRDLEGEELTDAEITKVENEYNSFKDKVDDYISDLEDYVHSTLDDYFEDLQDDHDRNMEDLDTIVEDIKEGTESTIAEKINDFVDDLSDVEDDVTALKDGINSTISSTTALNDEFDDLSDYLDDAENAVEDLEGETYSDAEKKRATDAFSDLEDAFTDAMDMIEDNVSGAAVEDEFDTEKDDLESDIDAVSADLTSILKGGGTTSQAMNNLIDDIKDARDDIADILDNDLAGMGAGSITDRTDVRGYSDDIQDALDDAVDSLTGYEGDPSTLGINRLKSTINSLEDKKDDTLDTIEEYLADNDNLEDTFDDEKDDVDSKWDEVEEAAQLIYDRAPVVEDDDEDENNDEEDEEGAKDEDGDGNVDFSDVNSRNPFKEYIDALTGMKVIKGYSDGSFKPNNQVTRGEFLKMVAGASEADLESIEDDAADFTDVKKTNDFYQWINYAASKGYIKGYTDGSFKPYEPITRFEAVAILLRFKGVEVSNVPAGSQYFIDVASPSIAGYTDAAFEQKILSGYPDNTFRPQNNITRGETAKVVVLAFS